MSSVRVYLSTKDEDGVYGDNIEITKYVSKVGTIRIDADSNDFQLGVFRTSSVAITLNNRSGKFADVGEPESIFPYYRSDSIVQITWMDGPELSLAGFAICGMVGTSEETLLFEGLLSDESLKENSQSEEVEVQILGFESLFANEIVPFADLVLGDSIQDLIVKVLNQPNITEHLTIDVDNISLGISLVPDSILSLDKQTVRRALDEFLKVSNSVLYIEDRTVYVKSRAASPSVDMKFYGQAAQSGIENLIDVKNIASGLPKTINYFFWRDSLALQQNFASVAKLGVRSYEFSSDLFTDLTKQNQILANLLAEFKDPKKTFEIVGRLDYVTSLLGILSRVSVDYPTVFNAAPGFSLPILGVAILGSSSTGPTGAVLPVGQWSLTVDPDQNWKTLSTAVDPTNETVTLKVREI